MNSSTTPPIPPQQPSEKPRGPFRPVHKQPVTRTYKNFNKTTGTGQQPARLPYAGSKPHFSSTAPRPHHTHKAPHTGTGTTTRTDGKNFPHKSKSSSSHGNKRGSSATHRAIQKLKKDYVYSLEVSERQQQTIESIPPLNDGDIRVVPVCGTEWVGTNMTFVEYKDEIVIIDAGFGFGNPDTPGIEYTVPNVAYLKNNRHKIKAMVITHGHLDHVGGIPYVIEDLGFPPIYTREFGGIFIQKKMEEFPQIKEQVKIEIVDAETNYLPISEHFKVKFFGLTHSIPDSSGVIVQTPLGGIVSTGDVRVESHNGIPIPEEVAQYDFFENENILLLLMDSTNIDRPGWSVSEEDVQKTIDGIIKDTNGRLFVAAFSSQVERLMSFMKSAHKHGKYIAFEGRSIISNMAIAEQLGLADFSHVIPIAQIDEYPPNKVVVVITGSQGEEFSALNRAANGTHKSIKFNPSDTIVLSSSIVPGNGYNVTQMKNDLYKGSYKIIAHTDDKVHASGHGNREELKWIHGRIPYKFFMPVHGEPYMIRMHTKMAIEELGLDKNAIVIPENGSIAEIRNNGTEIIKLEEKIPAEIVVVDGSYYGPLHKVVMDDRKALADDGMFVVVVSIDTKTGKLKKSPDIISRGFVYLRESKDLLNKVRLLVKRSVELHIKDKNNQVEFEDIKNLVTEKVSKFLLQDTHKEPIVIPVVLGV